MASAEEKRVAKLVREAVKAGGYNYWYSYNDKLKSGRKLKFVQNGFDYTSLHYANWTEQIQKELKRRGVQYKSAQFEECERPGYGYYHAFVVRI